MSPSEIKRLLSELGGGPNKRLGQHFLIDVTTLHAVADAALREPDLVTLEIGPGLGVLTQALLARGLNVIAIERDKRFVERIQNMSDACCLQGDAARLDWAQVTGEREWQLISNLPYSISSLALRKALGPTHPAKKIVVLVQREVGERAITTAPKGKTSLLSLMVALSSASTRILRRVPPGAFYPPPKVESVVLQITPMSLEERYKRWGIDPEEIMKFAKSGFAHSRKKMSSNFKKINVLPQKFQDLRAEDLSPDDWAELTREICLKR